MTDNLNGGKFKKEEQKKEQETQFLEGPSLIKTDDVFAMLGEQLVQVANWKKISLAWQKQFEALKAGTIQLKAKYEELLIANKQFGDSNIKYVENNNKLGNRITELNRLLEESNKVTRKFEADYKQSNTRYEGVINHNDKLSKTIEECNIKIKDKDIEIEKLKDELVRLKEKATKKAYKKIVR